MSEKLKNSRQLSFAKLAWNNTNQPFSTKFQDIYFSEQDGLEETQHTFLEANQLAHRFSENLENGATSIWDKTDVFQIGELGFGTGLNFLATWDLFLREAKSTKRLSYVSIEAFPLSKEDMHRALLPFNQISPLAEILMEAYPPLAAGIHRLHLSKRVVLTLIFGLADKALSSLAGSMDAWFLDGFAPSKNPDMWTSQIFKEIARLSHPQTTFSTFTAAGSVRRGLNEVGFKTQKVSGYGKKREMLTGEFIGSKGPNDQYLLSDKPWYHYSRNASPASQKAIVIGSGIAGASVAQALIHRGWQVEVLERRTDIAQQASSNPSPLVRPRLAIGNTPEDRFCMAAYFYALEFLQQDEYKTFWHQSKTPGLVELAVTQEDQSRHQALLEAKKLPKSHMQPLTAKEASSLIGLQTSCTGLYFPQAGAVNGQALCRALLEKADIQTNADVYQVRLRKGIWQVLDHNENTIAQAAHIIVANGPSVYNLQFIIEDNPPQQVFYPDWFKLTQGELFNTPTATLLDKLKLPISFGKHIVPRSNAPPILGSTFHNTLTENIDNQSNTQDLKNLSHRLNNVFSQKFNNAPDLRSFWSGIRHSPSDRLPIAGAIPDHHFYEEIYQDVHHGRHYKSYPPAKYYPGLYAHIGLGARGFLTSFLSAEIIASQITGESLPLETDSLEKIHPARFLIRDFKRGRVRQR